MPGNQPARKLVPQSSSHSEPVTVKTDMGYKNILPVSQQLLTASGSSSFVRHTPAVNVTFRGARIPNGINGKYLLVSSLGGHFAEWTDLYVKLDKANRPQYWLQYTPQNLHAFAKVARFPLDRQSYSVQLTNLRRVFDFEETGEGSGVVAKWKHGSTPWFVHPLTEKFR